MLQQRHDQPLTAHGECCLVVYGLTGSPIWHPVREQDLGQFVGAPTYDERTFVKCSELGVHLA